MPATINYRSIQTAALAANVTTCMMSDRNGLCCIAQSWYVKIRFITLSMQVSNLVTVMFPFTNSPDLRLATNCVCHTKMNQIKSLS